VPVVAEPSPVLDPAVDAPVDAEDVLGVVGVTPIREDEDHLPPQAHGDLVLVLQDVLALVLPEVGGHDLGARDHLVADHRRLVSPQEAENVVGATLNRHLRRERALDEGVAELLDLPGVGRVDQSREPLVTELLQQVRHGAKTFELATHRNVSRPFLKDSLLTDRRQRGKRVLVPAFFLLI